MWGTIFDFQTMRLKNPTLAYVRFAKDLSDNLRAAGRNLTEDYLDGTAQRPVYYVESFEPLERTDSDGEALVFSVTTIYPGNLAGEYHFTKGHYHLKEFNEIYWCLEGSGLLLLKKGATERTLDFSKGMIYEIPAEFAHRVVNTSDSLLIFISVYPKSAGFDYERLISEGDFKTRITCDS